MDFTFQLSLINYIMSTELRYSLYRQLEIPGKLFQNDEKIYRLGYYTQIKMSTNYP